jgi:hypothetical protein
MQKRISHGVPPSLDSSDGVKARAVQVAVGIVSALVVLRQQRYTSAPDSGR